MGEGSYKSPGDEHFGKGEGQIPRTLSWLTQGKGDSLENQIKEIETSVKKDIKKNQIEVLELKTTLEIKRSVNGLKSRIEKIKNQ